jgi:co-chaperonin GroES (HSP10)
VNVEMTNDNVLIRPTHMEKSDGGIILPDSHNKKDRPVRGVILKCGPGADDAQGKWVKMPYRPGMHVMFHQYPSLMVDDPEKNGDVLYVIAQRQIVACEPGPKGGK